MTGIRKGKISEINGKKARVVFGNKDKLVSPVLPVAEHVSELLAVGDTVVVAYWNDYEGAVIARIAGD